MIIVNLVDALIKAALTSISIMIGFIVFLILLYLASFLIKISIILIKNIINSVLSK